MNALRRLVRKVNGGEAQFTRSYARGPSSRGPSRGGGPFEPLRPARSDPDLRKLFLEWAKYYNKQYKTGEDMEFRYQNFKVSANVEDRNNSRGYATIQDLNSFADFTEDELTDYIYAGSKKASSS